MQKRSDIFLLVVAVMNAINTAVQWFAKLSSFGWSRETWLGIGVVVFFGVVIIFMVRVSRAETKKEKTALPSKEQTVPSQISITDEQKELLDFYERQKDNWKSNLRLRITNVKPALDAAVPKVTFELKMVNFLPVEVKLTKVVDSSGTVNAIGLGLCELPAFKGETIDETIHKSDTLSFSLKMEVDKTGLPEFLRPKLTEGGQFLQWIIKAKWYVEIEGKIQPWNPGDLLYDQVIAKQ